MGKVRTGDIKETAKTLYDKFPARFWEDFEKNKKTLDEMEIIPLKKFRNKTAGYLVRIVKHAKRSKL